MGNGSEPNPDGWGLLLGGSLFRRMELHQHFRRHSRDIPRRTTCQATTWHSARGWANAAVHNQGETTDYQHKVRMFFRAQHGFQEATRFVHTMSPTWATRPALPSAPTWRHLLATVLARGARQAKLVRKKEETVLAFTSKTRVP